MSRQNMRRLSVRWSPRVHSLEERITPTVTWDGGGGNFEWFTAANWSTNVVPGALDDVEVSNTGNGFIYYKGGTTAIKSLKLDDSLLLETGTLSISGGLTITSGRFLRTNGAGVDVTVLGATNIDEGNIQAYSDSTISLPGLTAINTKADVFLDARGGNSAIDVPNLTSVTTTTGSIHIRAIDGGIVTLDKLTKIENSSFDIYAADPGSVVDAPLLNSLTTSVGQTSFVTAVLGGAINVGPMLKSLDRVRLSLDGGGFPVGQLVSFKHESMYLSGGTPSFVSLTTIDSAGLYASSGAQVTLPGLTSIATNDSGDTYIDASGAATSVTISNLLTVAKQDPYRIHFNAFDDGTVSVPQLTSLAAGNADVRATDGGTVNMPMLATISPPSGSLSYIAAYGGGKVVVAPALATLDRVQLEMSGSGFPTAQLTSFKHASLFVYGGSPSLASLTTLDSAGVSVQNDAIVVMSGITNIPASDGGEVYIDVAYGTPSLSLPNLATVAKQDPYRIHFRAHDGGTMALAKLTSLAAGNSELAAYSNGKINAPLLASFSPPTGSYSYLGAHAGGVVTIAPGLTTLERVQLEVEDAGFPTAQLTALNHSAIYVYGGSPSFANVTTLESTGISVQNDGAVVMSGITNIPSSDSGDMYFDAGYGPASLTFPNLVSVAKQNPYRIHFRAFFDGTVSIPLVTSLAAGNADLTTYNNGKILAPLLASYSPPSGSYSIIAAFAGGSITVAPTLTTLDGVQLEVEGTGFPLAQLTSFKHAGLYVYGGTHTLTKLTEFASAGISVQNDAVVIMSGITTIPASDNNNDVYFDAGFGGSTLNPSLSLPNLVSVAKQDPQRIHFRAYYGGTVSLGSLTSLAAGNAELSAFGNATVNAPALVSFSPPTGSGSFINVSDNSSIKVAAGLTQLERTDFAIDSATSFPIAQLTAFKNGRMDIYGGTMSFAALSDLTNSSVFVNGTAVVTMPGVVSLTGATTFSGTYLQAAGDCKLSFPNLTTLTGSTSGDFLIRAYDSGEVSMPLVTQFNTGGIYIYAEDMDSIIDLSSLNALTIPATSFAYVTAIENATIKTAASISMLRVQFGFDDTAHFNFANLDLGLESTMLGFGTLKANVTNAGTIDPGYYNSPNSLTIDGKYTQTSTGHLRVDLGGTTAGTGYDQLVVTGQANLNGAVDVYLSFGFQPNLGNTFDAVTFASRIGNFSGYSGLDVGNNVELSPVHGATNFQLTTVASTGAIVTKFLPNGLMPAPSYSGPITYFEVTFSEAIDSGSVDAGDISVTGPGGPYAVTGIGITAPNVIQFYFDPISLNGTYSVVLGPEILDVAGNKMNQNGVAPNGEVPADQYSTTFTIAAVDLVIDAFTGVPANANFGQSINLSWTIRNGGVAPTTGGWSDRIWLSTDAKVDFGDIVLGEKASPGIPMNVNDTYMSNLTVQLPLVPPSPDGSYFILLQTDTFGQLGEANEMNNVKANATTLANPPRVIQVTVNNGDPQRSRVNTLTVVFSETVSFSPNAAAAFSVTRTGPGTPMGTATLAAPVVDNSTAQTKVTLTFVNDAFYNFGSLIDGKYQLTVNAANVSDGSQALDGNNDGIVGDSHTFNFLRLFGDGNGDGSVTASDFNQFRLAYGGGPSIFDFNNDGVTSATDFNAFRTRYGVSLVP